ncbi:glycoside hydrolase family 30 protein [Streptomyces radicis]|uniref:Glucosylceramidase n=1 Tax=Streptomyces radicis TaxID=1750517 RepID=A0A3A9VQZ8_9ACTN|nr:glycoside hydrolase [Streptomyces radicis]RKN03455.1 hypothetical protein D7319_31445 [Streptomyces radicis]RKN13317.1 hypothetical protein D7318_31315 [Streptomyces radicis]
MNRTTRTVVAGTRAATLLPLASATAGAETAGGTPRASGSVDFGDERQLIDGFGISQAFQRADIMNGAPGLTPEHQREVLDLLFDTGTGAGLSILRLGIGSSADEVYDHMRSIQPDDPGGPDAQPRYEWDGYDGGQLWLAREAREYGVERFYADAWSAPGYMKTNGDDANGGALCGLPGVEECVSGDWRRAYAEYLVQYARFYAEEGVEITDLGFTNEPDWVTDYASMEMTPEQAADMATIVADAVADSELSEMNVVCCDTVGWSADREYTEAIEADPEAAAAVDIQTGHRYGDPARSPLPTDDHTWMSEWSPPGPNWNEAWDDGSGYDGFTVAEDILGTLTQAEANGYVYWFGASINATRALIQMDGPDYHVSKRLWGMAAFSRFIRPDAVRVGADSGSEAVRVAAFRNTDGSNVLEILNTGTGTVRQTLDVDGPTGRNGDVYLTDETHDLQRTGGARVTGGRLSVDLPPRSLTTVVLDQPAGVPPPH